MISRSARIALLAAFLVAVMSGPVLALCQADVDRPGCCCTHERKCPRPSSSQAAAEACCKATPPAAPATHGQTAGDRAAAPADGDSLHTAPAPPAPFTRAALRHDPTSERIAAGVGLYTLHAAFLI